MDATKILEGFRVIPVVVLDSVDAAVPLAEALLEGGLGIAEITLRSDDALAGVSEIARRVPDMVVGVGSIRHSEQFAMAVDAGAQFAVSPGHSERLLQAAGDCQLPFVPGAVTPSEMISLLEKDYRLQKFFPAGQAGGVALLKSVSTPLPEITFMPTGGITQENATDYLSLPNVSGVGGSWITPIELQRSGDFATITSLAKAGCRRCRAETVVY